MSVANKTLRVDIFSTSAGSYQSNTFPPTGNDGKIFGWISGTFGNYALSAFDLVTAPGGVLSGLNEIQVETVTATMVTVGFAGPDGSTGNVYFYHADSAFAMGISTEPLTADRNIKWPNRDGTVALEGTPAFTPISGTVAAESGLRALTPGATVISLPPTPSLCDYVEIINDGTWGSGMAAVTVNPNGKTVDGDAGNQTITSGGRVLFIWTAADLWHRINS